MFTNLGKKCLVELDDLIIEGVIKAVIKDSIITEKTPAWVLTKTEYTYLILVEENDIGILKRKHKEVEFA